MLAAQAASSWLHCAVMCPSQRPVRDLPDVFRGRDVVAERVLTVEQLRGPLVRRVVQGVYRPSWVPLTHSLQCRAVALVLPDGAAVTGASCATLQGVEVARPGDPVEVCVPAGVTVRPRAGVAVRWSRAQLDDVRHLLDVPVVESRRMAFDLAARQPLPRAVARLDATVRAGLVDADDFRQWLAGRRENDVRHVRRASELIDPRAESQPESEVRVVLTDAGFDVVPQHVVRTGPGRVARLDLAVVALKIGIEYDGAWHALREQLRRDRERLNELMAAGWIIVHVTAAMLASPAQVVAAVQAAVASRRTRSA